MLPKVSQAPGFSIDVADDTFVAAIPARVAAAVHERDRWRDWWPDLELAVTRDRGAKGIQWTVVGGLVGTAEIWLEPYADGVLLHLYLRADPTRSGTTTEPAPVSSRSAARLRRRRALAWKRSVHALKDELEAGRPPGTPAVGANGTDVKAAASPAE
jgi:hypothetical protein